MRFHISDRLGSVAGILGAAILVCAPFVTREASSHGDVVPQAVDVSSLPALKNGPLTENPYRGNEKVRAVGASAYNQNCARCHGIGAVSGGIAPDLRQLPAGSDGDEYFQMRVRNGSIRNGITYMPPFGEIFPEEAIWAVRTWLESVSKES